MAGSNEDMVSAIKQAALDCGYIDCGITAARPFDIYAEALQKRIALFPETRELYQPMLERCDPCRNAPWVNSIIVCVHQYGKYRLPNGLGSHIGRNYLADRRNPANPDYANERHFTTHLRAMGLRVKRGGVPERLVGMLAGVTQIGRNGFAYHPRGGSWINIESWRVDLPLPTDQPAAACPCPAGCRRCMDACPTKALREPYLMRMDHCIAHLTYHAAWPIPKHLWHAMGNWIYGCDICQLVCPLNRDKWKNTLPMPWLDAVKSRLTPQALATMDAETYRRFVHPHFWYIPKDDVERWRANAGRVCNAVKC